MTDINIATTLVRKRKEKRLTQEALAQFLGVSKASVSKWETGMSYPDISLLPQLASYFDISIDELMGYDPQMSKKEIRALYTRLSNEASKRPIKETLDEWHEVIKKYYACYPLLVQMGVFMINNANLIEDERERKSVLEEVATIFKRVQDESRDVSLSQLALELEAMSYLTLGDPDTTLSLLEDLANAADMPPELIVLSAYQQKGEILEAKRVSQVGLLQNLVTHFNFVINYLYLTIDDPETFAETVKRAYAVANAYDFEHLHPVLQLSLDLVCAVGYCIQDEKDKALDILESYARVLGDSKITLTLHGDTYFDLVDSWLEDLDIGTQLPRNKELVKNDLIAMVDEHPGFAILHDDKRFQAIHAKLERLKD
ncbi:MAG: helix-turn-helix domain-containing protein [Raoultibacter sp.]|jgi:transcriptional regulator with XRE-family HTH domain